MGVSELYLQFQIIDGYEMMHKAWSSIEDVPYYFSRSSAKFQDHTGQKIPILTRIERFRTETPVWNRLWLWNDSQSLT